jgi:aldehyde dehydrogenase (NAD+)
MKTTLTNFFGTDPKTSADVSRIITKRHAERVIGLVFAIVIQLRMCCTCKVLCIEHCYCLLYRLLDDSTIEILVGGKHSADERFIEPTIVRATKESKCMQQEIFGPILPIIVVENVRSSGCFMRLACKMDGTCVVVLAR